MLLKDRRRWRLRRVWAPKDSGACDVRQKRTGAGENANEVHCNNTFIFIETAAVLHYHATADRDRKPLIIRIDS